MKATRIIALVLVLVMALGIFAGCQQNTNPTTKPNSGNTPTGGNDGTTAGSTSNLPEYLRPGQFPLVEGEEITLDIGVMLHDNTEDPTKTYQYKFIEEVMGVKLNITYSFYTAQKAESISLMFADGDLPDMMIGMGLDASQIVQYGMVDEMLLDLKPYINAENTPNLMKVDAIDPNYLKAMTTPNGAIYSLGEWGEPNPDNNAGVYRMFYNWDVMNECGITEAPETLDEFLTMLRTIKAQKPEMYPFGGNYARYNATYLIMNALGFNLSLGGLSADQKSHETDIGLRNGEITLFSYDKEMLPVYLEFMNTLYEEGLMEPDYYTLEKDTCKAHLTSGMYAVFSEVPGLYGGVEFGTQWWGGKPLTSELNDTAFYPSNNTYAIGNFAVSADTEYPELCVAFADLFFGQGELNRLLNGGPSVNQVEKYGLGVITQGWFYDYENGYTVYKDYLDVKEQYTNENYWVFGTLKAWYPNTLSCSWRAWNTDENGQAVPETVWELNEPDVNKSAAMRKELEAFMSDMDSQWQYALHNTFAKYETTEIAPKNVFFSAEQLAQVADYKTLLDGYASQMLAEFITGRREINEENLNAYFAEMKKLGAEEYIAIYAEYWAGVNG